MTSVNSALAATWNSDYALDAARQIASIPSVYCGPASAGWIAAVWNHSKGRPYDFRKRLNDKNLFPDGPRLFHGMMPGFQFSLSDLLMRETNGELKLSNEIYFKANTVHDILNEFQMPFIIRLIGSNIRNGLHYVVVYRSQLIESNHQRPTIDFYRQDNGLFGKDNSGLSRMIVGKSHSFLWGTKRVILS